MYLLSLTRFAKVLRSVEQLVGKVLLFSKFNFVHEAVVLFERGCERANPACLVAKSDPDC